MLNYPSAERFFDNCLLECGLLESKKQHVALAQIKADPAARSALLRTLRDIQTGADAVLARGKPAEDTLNLPANEWEKRWNAWAASRKAAFFSRAAMLMLGEKEFFPYFVQTLSSSFNIVFLGASSDVLQHATKLYLNGPEEDLSNSELARWWQAQEATGNLNFS
ncbi:MAG TPA: hypothetical protein VH186_22765 [Chloroflexia bacterium]|nr:hypothetical protein [Chloroflexia bacterium]